MAKDGLEIKQSFYFDVPPEEVFRALTEPEQLIRWFLAKAKVDLKKGGKIEFVWMGGQKMASKVKKVVPNKQVAYAWQDELPKGKKAKTLAEFKVVKKGKGSLLKLTHSGFGEGKAWIEPYGAIQSGWAYYLTNLKSLMQNDVDLRSKYDW